MFVVSTMVLLKFDFLVSGVYGEESADSSCTDYDFRVVKRSGVAAITPSLTARSVPVMQH
jgi:hypothetical protein